MSVTDRKIVILGAKGMLGTDIVKVFTQQGPMPHTLDLPEFDLTDRNQLREAIDGKDIVINCAAYTNVEKAESESGKAFAVNAEAVGTLGAIASQTGTTVIHISTDFVFDGTLDRPYAESDTANPISVYGKSKFEGENLLLSACPNACIIRVEWTYGKNGNNFASKMIELAGRYSTLKVVSDQVGSPTATTEVANAILELLDDIPTGIFHFAAEGFTSRYGMAELIFKELGIKVNLEKCDSTEYKTAAQRPLNSRFNTDKIRALLKNRIKPWDQALIEYLKRT